MNNFETIIGIEIHLELNTKTKMFSSAKNDFNDAPNTNASVIDLAYPGTLPQLNKEAIVKGIQLSKALKMTVDHEIHFDRKNYFYPDLPKGFQTTQQERPIGSNGVITIEVDGIKKDIEIERAHMEEDTAKSTHINGMTLLDYNRAGVPLIEIVTKPVIRSSKEAAAYIDAIRQVALALDISDAKMEEGSLRADLNISIRPFGKKEFGTKVEVKNINSISNAEKAIELEVAEQIKKVLKGEEITQATKRFDDSLKQNVVMRVKSNAVDYKYYPEPNIPIIKLSKEWVDSIQIAELPWETKERLLNENVDVEYIEQLIADRDKLKFFDSINLADKSKVAKLFFAEIVSLANTLNKKVSDLGINSSEIQELIIKQESGEISGAHIKKIVPLLVGGKTTVAKAIVDLGFIQISDESVLGKMIELIIENNSSFISENKERPERVLKYILGLLMKDSKGQANPVVADKLVKQMLGM